jgi:hypothetical protein
MIKYFLAFVFAFAGLIETYSQFIVKDILAVHPQASIFDPEYNPELNLVCWKSDSNDLWVSGLDPVTRLFKPSDGKGTYVTGNLSPNGSESVNGPEWMLSSQGTQIVYVKAIWGIRYPGVATMILGGWHCFTLLAHPNAVYTMATANYSDSAARFLFETFDDVGIHWISNTNLFKSYYYPDITLGFFARDNQQICCATDKSRHPGFVETAGNLPFLTLISQDTIGAPFMWHDPASDSRLFMYRTNGFKTLKIFRELSPDFWVLYKKFDSPLPEPYVYITSPEPFTCGGKSYISFMAAQSGSGKDGLPAEIWIASADPDDNFMRRVSDSTVEIRTDPEPVVFSDSAFIYYTHVLTDKPISLQYSVRKCDTGLGNLYTAVKEREEPKAGISIYPNPGKGLFNFNSQSLFDSGSQIEIYDISGQKVYSTMSVSDNGELNLSHLPDGSYILKIQDHNKEAVTKFTISK